MNDTVITLIGNLVADPELRYTPNGQAVAQFRVASTPRYRDNSTGEWKDGDTLFLTCQAWRQLAENAAEHLAKGARVIVMGRLRQRSYEAQDGGRRTVYEVQADDIATSLRGRASKTSRSSGSGDNGSHPWASEPSSDEPPF